MLERLRDLDEVAYLRFASVYKGFDDLADFEREIGLLAKATAPKRPGRAEGRDLCRPPWLAVGAVVVNGHRRRDLPSLTRSIHRVVPLSAPQARFPTVDRNGPQRGRVDGGGRLVEGSGDVHWG